MKSSQLSWLWAVVSVFGLLAGSVSGAGEATIKPENLPVYSPKFFPFDKGEKEVYRATWNGLFSVATAEVTTKGLEKLLASADSDTLDTQRFDRAFTQVL